MFRYALLAVAFLALTQAKSDKCPWAIGKYPFDEAKFSGQWFSIAELAHKDFTGVKKCGKMNFDLLKTEAETKTHITGSFLLNEKNTTAEGYSTACFEKKGANYNTVWKKDYETKFSAVYKQSIIATDYDTYAIFMACKPEFDEETKTFDRSLHAKILSRKITLGEETLKTLMNVLSGYDIDISLMKMTDHTSC